MLIILILVVSESILIAQAFETKRKIDEPYSPAGSFTVGRGASDIGLSDKIEGRNTQSVLGKLEYIRQEDFRRVVHSEGDSVELAVGVDAHKSRLQTLTATISSEGGEVTDVVFMGTHVSAVIVKVQTSYAYLFAEKLEASGMIRYVEPNFITNAFFEPNDAYWPEQWGPRKMDADIAWNTSIGSSDILVAVLDTGIDYSHPDLAANYVPLGYDWVNNDTNPMDDNGHGTHVAGIIAAQMNNSIGIAGLAQVRMMAEKVLDSGGQGQYSWLAQGIIHATNQGAKIISMSLGGDEDSDMLHDAVQYAYNHSVLIVAAAGNSGGPIPSYPAVYDEVIAVSATDQLDNLASFSSYGSWIELSAPGVDIYSTLRGGYYGRKSGTSMACPQVTGVAALSWSVYRNFTRDELRQFLRRTADDLGTPGFDIYYGYGRVNARKAVTDIPAHDLNIYGLNHADRLDPGIPTVFNVTVGNLGQNNETNISVQFLVNDSLADSSTIDFVANGTTALTNFTWQTDTEGHYNVTAYVVPVPGEDYFRNNVVSTSVLVRTPVHYIVPDDYPTIQEAVNNAFGDDSIFVRSGVYTECVTIDKAISLIGENPETTIIDANWTGTAVWVGANGTTVSGFTLQHSRSTFGGYYAGVHLQRNSGNSVSGNIIINNAGIGIFVDHSDGNSIINNTISNNSDAGIWLQRSKYNVLRTNNLTANALGMRDNGDYYQDIDTSNTINGKPIYYLVNQTGVAINPQTFPVIGYLAVVNSTDIRIEDLTPATIEEGITLYQTNGVVITNNTFTTGKLSISLSQGQNAAIYENEFRGKELLITASFNNTIFNNTMKQSDNGVTIIGGWNNTLYQNNITNNNYGVYLSNTWTNNLTRNEISNNTFVNVYLWYALEHMVSGNVIANSKYGIFQHGFGNHTIVENDIMNNAYSGILIEEGWYGDTIFHNNIINNGVQTYQSSNTWTDGYPSGGNYWSNYPIVDVYSGQYQNESGSDGIGDTPYVIDANNTDPYPLAKPYRASLHDMGLVGLFPSKTVVGRGYSLNITVCIRNWGISDEVFNFTLFMNKTKIVEQTQLPLSSQNFTVITLKLEASDFAKGNYNLTTWVTPMDGETDTADNNQTRQITITIAGDVTSTTGLPDGRVDMRDIGDISSRFMFTPSSPGWDPNYDINGDGVVNMRDIGIACNNFMKT